MNLDPGNAWYNPNGSSEHHQTLLDKHGGAEHHDAGNDDEDSISEEEEAKEITCAICLDGFTIDQQVVLLPCKSHSFHVPCIEMWLKKNSICPVCRFQVTKHNLVEQKKQIQ